MAAISIQSARQGFTLIEILLTLALAAFVLAISIALYQYAKQAYIDNGAQLRVTEKLIASKRIFSETLNGSIKSCSAAPTRLSLVNSTQLWLQAGASAVEIYPGQNNISSFKRVGDKIGERDIDSDVLLLRAARLPATSLVAHSIENNKFIAQNSIGLTRSGLAIVCDENAAVVFQVAYTTGRHIHYAGGGIAPGNCANAFSDERCGGSYRFAKGALLAHYTPTIFYIANSHAGPALYRQKPIIFRRHGNRRLSMRAQELVSGIMRLHAAADFSPSKQNNGLALQLTIAKDAHSRSDHYETYMYTLPL
ncbi:MAG: prepilin-type N-terminal cleavage/methylation domain-containing protein [Chromatiales bacterium]|nr:prepilin-type N-terminal cleavage/methylation domain-containing protein [Chromatiales bacterium]